MEEKNNWVTTEISAVEFGDKRLNKRCVKLLEDLGDNPSGSLPSACKGWPEIMAAYRFLDNELVTHEKILRPHKEATIKRIQGQKIVLLCQDTTGISYTGREKINGLGALTEEYQQGLYLHGMLAITPNKLCLGVVDSQIWTRAELGKRRRRKKQDISEKESYRWIKGYEEANEIARKAPDTMVVAVGDRESDIYELFCKGKEVGNEAYWLVRVNHDRELLANGCNKTKKRLKEELLNMPVISTVEYNLSKGKGSRKVRQEVRVSKVTIKPPARKEVLGDVEATVVYCREINTPKGEESIEWILLSNIGVDSEERALEIVQWYLCRWQVEVYFRILKSGCLVEELQLKDAKRIEVCLALYMIVAWRILYVTMLGRSYPDIRCDVVFEEAEWKSAYYAAREKHPPKKAPLLKEMMRMIAELGGYLGRKSDGEPGAQAIWIGMQRMQDMAYGWYLALEAKA